MLGVIVPSWYWLTHPLAGDGYQFWSGLASDVSEITVLIGFVLALWRIRKHFECHVESPRNCHKFGHPVAGTGHRACRQHHPHAEAAGSTTEADIGRHHADAAQRQAAGLHERHWRQERAIEDLHTVHRQAHASTLWALEQLLTHKPADAETVAKLTALNLYCNTVAPHYTAQDLDKLRRTFETSVQAVLAGETPSLLADLIPNQ